MNQTNYNTVLWIIAFILFCWAVSSCEPANANSFNMTNQPNSKADLQFKCERVIAKSLYSFIGSAAGQRINRCENSEVVCYVSLGDTNDNLFCKFKK